MEHKAGLFVLWALCCLTKGDSEQLSLSSRTPAGPAAAPRPPASGPSSSLPPVVAYDVNNVARPLCAPEVGDHCLYRTSSTDEYFYTINGRSQLFAFAEGNYFKMSCAANAIDDPALPRFARPLRFGRVMLSGCGPPARGSYAAALRRLNVLPTRRLALLKLPAGANLTRAALAAAPDAPALSELELEAAPRTGPLALAPGVVDALPLRVLLLSDVSTARLPSRLLRLRLRDASLTRLPEPLDDLETLEVTESSLEEAQVLAGLERLRELTLSAPLPAWPPLPPELQNVTLFALRERAPPPLQACPSLRELTLGYGALARLPAALAAACPQLQALSLQFLRALEALPPALLQGAQRLRVLRVTFCPSLRALPDDLFHYSPELEEVILSRNKLQFLPNGVFAPLAGSLRALDLSHNELRAVAELRPLTALRQLALASNPLGDLCPDAPLARSALAPLLQLRRLSLSATDATRLCIDWLQGMKLLQRADLSKNRIETVQLTQLNLVQRLQPSELDLKGNPLRAVLATAADVARAADLIPPEHMTLVLLEPLPCTCEAHGLWVALRLGRVRVRLEPLCSGAGGVPLRAMVPERLTCAAGGGCEYSPHEGGLLRCSAPPPPSLLMSPRLPLRALVLAGANLTELPAPLPDGLQYVDLDDNQLSAASPAAAAALLAHGRRVRLTRNPLDCRCGAPLLNALRLHSDKIEDLANTTCSTGRPLAAMLGAACGARVGLWLGVACAAFGLCAALLLASLLASAELRLRIKAVLHARGVGGRWLRRRAAAAAGDALRPFDVFVSHAPADERWVLTVLAPRLYLARLRPCLRAVHWPPGAWIPDQIEASVRGARHTLVVLSGHWAAAQWAAAELRAAHAAALQERRPRLLLLSLPGAPVPPLRAPLLRWGEPCFWEKLFYALPDPPDPPAAAAAD